MDYDDQDGGFVPFGTENVLTEGFLNTEPLLDDMQAIDNEAADYTKKIHDLENGNDVEEGQDNADEDDEDFDDDEFEDEEIDLNMDDDTIATSSSMDEYAANPWKAFIRGVRASFKLWDGLQFAITQHHENKAKAAEFCDLVIERFQQYTVKIKPEECAEDLDFFVHDELHTILEDGSTEWMGKLLVQMFYDTMVSNTFELVDKTILAAAERKSNNFNVVGDDSDSDDDDDDDEDDEEDDNDQVADLKQEVENQQDTQEITEAVQDLSMSGKNLLTEPDEEGWQTVVSKHRPKKKKW